MKDNEWMSALKYVSLNYKCAKASKYHSMCV